MPLWLYRPAAAPAGPDGIAGDWCSRSTWSCRSSTRRRQYAAELPLTVQSVNVVVPCGEAAAVPLTMPPVIVGPEIDAVTPRVDENTRLALLPEIDLRPLARTIVEQQVASHVLLSSS